jgi:hypothetical protein
MRARECARVPAPGTRRRACYVGRIRFKDILHGLEKLGLFGIRGVRITDTSGITRNPDGTASGSPGVSVYGVGVEE